MNSSRCGRPKGEREEADEAGMKGGGGAEAETGGSGSRSERSGGVGVEGAFLKESSFSRNQSCDMWRNFHRGSCGQTQSIVSYVLTIYNPADLLD